MRGLLVRFATSLTLLLSLLLAATASALPKKRARWFRIDTKNFTLFTDGGPKRAEWLGRELERFRSALALLAGADRVSSPVPSHVFIFRNDGAFRDYKTLADDGRPAEIAGYFMARPEANYLVLNGHDAEQGLRLIHHEYMHHVVSRNFPGVPAWLDEGLAEYYETFRANGTEIEVGHPVLPHLLRLRWHGLVPLEELFEVNSVTSTHDPRVRPGQFYAQSWGLVHYLANGRPDGGAQLARYLALLGNGMPDEPAFREAFGVSPDAMLEELARYLRGGVLSHHRIELKAFPVDESARRSVVPRPEMLARLGELLARQGPERWTEAEEHFVAALADDPGLARAHLGLGLLRSARGDESDAREHYRLAAELAPDDVRALFLHADALLRELWHARRVGFAALTAEQRAQLERGRSLLRECVRLAPDLGEAHAALGATWFLDGDGIEEGLSALERSRELLPWREDIVFDLVLLHLTDGNRPRAGFLVDRVLARLSGEERLRQAREVVAGAEARRAVDLVRDGHHRAAVVRMERTLAYADDSCFTESVRDRLERLRAIVAHGSASADQAVQLILEEIDEERAALFPNEP